MDWTELYIMHYIYIIYFIIIIVCAMTRVVEYVHTSPGHQTPSHWTTTNRVSPLTQTLHGSINQVSGLARTSAMVHPIRSLHSHEPPVGQPIRSLSTQMNPGRTTNQISPPKWTLVGQPIRSLQLTWIRLRRRPTAPPLPPRTPSCSPPASCSCPGTPGGRSAGSSKYNTNININGNNDNFVGLALM